VFHGKQGELRQRYGEGQEISSVRYKAFKWSTI
jgi:TnpA family transposase